MDSSAEIIIIGFSLVMLSLYIYEKLANKARLLQVQNREIADYSLLCNYNGGIFKRIDNLREDVELIANNSPELFHRYCWLYSHMQSCDEFLNELARRNGLRPEDCYIKITPREFPLVDAPKGIQAINKVWHDLAYPLKQITITAQGTKNPNKESLIYQLELALARVKKGDVNGYVHDDDFGYLFRVNEELQHSQFNGPAGLK